MIASLALLVLAAASCSRQEGSPQAQPPPAPSPSPVAESSLPPRALSLRAPVPTEPPPDAQKPDRLLQTGHTAEITALAFSPDRQWLATGSADTTIRIWDAATGLAQLTLAGHTRMVTGLAFSPDGRRMASTSGDGTLRVWDPASGASIYTLDFKHSVTAVTFSPDGQSLIASVRPGDEGEGTIIVVHDAASGQKRRAIPVDWNVATPLVVSADGRLISSGGAGDGGEHGSTKIWNLQSGEELKSIPIWAAISPDGHWMATSDRQQGPKITLWSVDSGQPVRTITVPDGNVGHIALSPDGRRLVAVKENGSEMTVWATETGREVEALPGKQASVTALAFSADAKLLAAGTYSGNSTKLWDLDAGHEVRTLAGQESVSVVAFSPDGRSLISGGNLAGSAVLKAWDLATGKDTHTVLAGPPSLTNMALSADGRRLATNLKGILKVWDTTSWTAAYVLPEDARIFPMGFGGPPPPPGEIADSGVKWWPLAGEPDPRTIWGCPYPAALSSDGKLLASAATRGGDVRVWDTASGDLVETLTAHKGGVLTLAFSPDGRWLMTVGQEAPSTVADQRAGAVDVQRAIKLWDVSSWQEGRSFLLSGMAGGDTAFSLDGRRLAVTTAPNLIQLFDIAHESPLSTLSSGESWTTSSMAFSPDGTWLAQGGPTGINLWRLPGAIK